MRTLTATLEAAQKSPSSRPAVKVEIKNQVGPAVIRAWSVLYTGAEADSFHAAVCPGDNSLVRARTDGATLYWQRVAVPAAGSDYSAWNSFGDSLVTVDGIALAALGAKVALFYMAYDAGVRTLYCRESTDYGATWGSAVALKTTADTSGFKHISAVYVSADVLICFFTYSTYQYLIYRMMRTSGTWGSSATWSNSGSNISITGISAGYDGTRDIQLLITGMDPSSNYCLWNCVYGLGVNQTNDTWSTVKVIRKTQVGTTVSYLYPYIGYKDIFWESFQEVFTGTGAYTRPMGLHAPAQVALILHHDDYKLPPISGSYGTAIANSATKAFLSTSKELYWAPNTVTTVTVSPDIVSVKQVIKPFGGAIEVVLRNDTGQYNTPSFDRGWELQFSPGYSGTAGAEYSTGQTYYIESMEYITASRRGDSRISHLSGVLRIIALDAFAWLGRSQARSALEFNKPFGSVSQNNEKTYKDLIEYFLALAGFTLTVVSNSSPFTAQYPKVSIYSGTNYDSFIKELYSGLTDLVYMRGAEARFLDPDDDASTYSYFASGIGVPPVHPILSGRYAVNTLAANRLQVQGGGTVNNGILVQPLYADAFIQSEIDKVYSRFKLQSDPNADNQSKSAYEAAALAEKESYHSSGGEITIPVNCGQEIHDVITITDSGAGLSSARRRVSGIELVYDTTKGKYLMTLLLESAEATYGI